MPKVLIVDDAVFMRTSLRKIFESAGFTTEEAENGAMAVEKYEEFSPDVVTMDITMPEMDGIQATKKLVSEHPDAKIVMVSALGQEASVKEAILSGAKDFIVKPFKAERVIEAVQKVLS